MTGYGWRCHKIHIWIIKRLGAERIEFDFAIGWKYGHMILFEYSTPPGRLSCWLRNAVKAFRA